MRCTLWRYMEHGDCHFGVEDTTTQSRSPIK